MNFVKKKIFNEIYFIHHYLRIIYSPYIIENWTSFLGVVGEVSSSQDRVVGIETAESGTVRLNCNLLIIYDFILEHNIYLFGLVDHLVANDWYFN